MNAHVDKPVTNGRTTHLSKYGAVAVWAALVVGGWIWMQRYDFAVHPPLASGIVEQWPTESVLAPNDEGPTLVVFMHPQCPCTRASIAELERLYGGLPTSVGASGLIVVATVPDTFGDEWLGTDTIARVEQMPGVQLFVDRGGHEAARFGATTSGTVMVFDANGARQYAGGITASRGHEGDNLGRATIADALRGKPVEHRDLPTFGCRLCLPSESESLALAQPSTQ